MVREINNSSDKKRKSILYDDKDYITEAYLQGGKMIGEIVKKYEKKEEIIISYLL